MNYSIRPYAAADRSALIEVIDAVCAESRWMRTPRFEPTPAWEHALASPHCSCHLLLIASDRKEVLTGWCRLFPTDLAGEVEVGIGLLARGHGQGLGGRLLRQAIAWASRRALSRLILTTQSGNRPALHLFHKSGFSTTDRLTGNWLQMEYWLDPSVQPQT